jgi:hypothetical protein
MQPYESQFLCIRQQGFQVPSYSEFHRYMDQDKQQQYWMLLT